MKAIILAGGYGTRLRPLTLTRPKAMLPLAGKPILQHILEYLPKHGFDDVFITTNYKRDQIEGFFKDGEKFGVKLTYPEESVPLGTAGSIKNVEKHLDETFAVIQGDNITNLNLKKVLKFHREKNGIATIALIHVKNPSSYGIAELDSKSKIVKFIEKPKPEDCFSNLVNTGLYIFEPQILDHIPKDKAYDFSKNLFPKILELDHNIYGYQEECFWIDVGHPVNLLEANNWMLNNLKKPKISETVENKGKVFGPVIIEDDVSIEEGVKITGPVFLGKACQIRADSVVKSNTVLEEGVIIGKRNRLSGAIIFKHTISDEDSKFNECLIGENCKFGPSTNIGQYVMIGANCVIGHHVNIESGSRVWPNIKIKSNCVINGVLEYSI